MMPLFMEHSGLPYMGLSDPLLYVIQTLKGLPGGTTLYRWLKQ